MASSTSQLQAKLFALTHGKVDIMLDANTFKNTTQILREMSAAWEDMTDIERASALELMGGKRQANILSSVIKNFDVVEDVIETSMDSTGSALRENEKYLESIQGRIDLFNNSLQTMWMNLIDSNAVKDVVDAGTTLVKVLDSAHGRFIAISAVLAGLAKWKLKVNFTDMFTNITGKLTGKDDMTVALQKMQSISGTGAAAIDKYVLALKNLSAAQQAQVLAIKGLAESEQLTILTRSLGSEAAAKQAIAEAALAAAQQEATGETLIRTIATKTQNVEFTKSFVATTGITGATGKLTEEQIKAALAALQQARATGKLSDEQYEAIVSTVGLDRATEGLNKNVGGLGQKLKDVWSANKATIVAAGVAIVAFAIEKLTTTFQEASEAATDAFDKIQNVVDSTTSTISGIESELSTIQTQIDELSEKELSFADQEKLDYLKSQEESLQRQLDTQNSILAAQEAARSKQAIAAVKAYAKASTAGAEETIEGWKTAGSVIGAIVAIGGWAASIIIPGDFGTIGLAASALASKMGTGLMVTAAGAYAGGVAGEAVGSSVANGGVNNYEEWYKTYTNAIEAARADEQKALEEYQKDTSNTDKLDKWQEAQQRTIEIETEMYDHLSQMESMMSSIDYGTGYDEILDDWYNFVDKIAIDNEAQGAVQNALDRLFGEDADEVVKAYANLARDAVAAGEAFNFTDADAETIGLDDDLETLGITTQQVTDYFTKLGEAGADAVEEIDFSDVVSELAQIEDALGSVKSVMEEFRTDGIVSASTLEGMQEKFGDLGEAWENYAETMMSGTASMSEAQAATEALAKAYLDDHANELNKDTRLTYIAQLEQFGVDNAKELVDSYINNSFWNSSEFDNFKGSAEELIALAKEHGVTIEDVSKVEELLVAKEKARNAELERGKQLLEQQKAAQETQKTSTSYEMTDLGYGLIGNSNYDYYIRQIRSAIDGTGDFATDGMYGHLSDEQKQAIFNGLVADFKTVLAQFGEYKFEDIFVLSEGAIEAIPEVTVSQEEVDQYGKELNDKLEELNTKVTPEVNFNENNALEETAEVEEAFASLKDVYDEFKENNIVSAKSLAGLQETFKNVDGFEEFTNILGNSTSTIEEVTTAIQGLANGFLNDFDYSKLFDDSGNLIESEATRVASQLENIGVANANELIRQKAWAYNQVKEMYGIDLTNYESAEDAKNGYLIQSVIAQMENTGKGMIDGFAEQYEDDLLNFEGTWQEKVQYAKECAQKILEANKASEIAALDADFENQMASTQDGGKGEDSQRIESWYLREKARINQKYADAESSVENINLPEINTDNIFKYYKPTTIDPTKLGGNDDKDGSGSDNELDWLDHYFTKIENKIKDKEADLENVLSADVGSIDDKNTIIDGIIGLYESKIPLLENAISAYNNRATALFNGFSSDIQNKILNGSIDINEYDDETAEKIQNYFDYITKASDLGIELDSVKVTIADFSLQKFDDAATAFDNEIEEKFQSDQDLIEAEIGYLEEQGKRVSPELYGKLISIQKAEQKVLENKKATLENILATEVAAGRVPVGSEQWYEMTNAINDVDEALIKSKQDLESFQNSINDIYWDNFDKIISRLDYISEETQGLIDLMSSMDMVSKPDDINGWGADDVDWTAEGLATLGLHAQEMERAEEKAKMYAIAIADLKTEYDAGHYSESEYYEKLNELTKGQYDAIKAAQDEKEAIVELNEQRVDAIKEGIEKEIKAYEKLIEKKQEELSAEKDLYDFQRSSMDNQKNIAEIERKLAALAYDNSMSAVAKRKQLEAELTEARQEQEDLYYNRSIDNQQDALDKELDSFKEEKDAEIEQWDKYLEDVEAIVAESLGIVKANAEEIGKTLTDKTAEYGLTVSDAVLNPWKDGASAIDEYTTKFGDTVSSTVDKLEPLRAKWQEIKEELQAANQEADKYYNKPAATASGPSVDDINAENAASNDVTPKPTEPPKEQPKAIKVGGKITAAGAKIYKWAGGEGYNQYYKNDPIYTVLEEVNGYLKVRHHKSKSGVDGFFKKADVKAYAKGTLGTKQDALALIDELGDELVMHAGPNGRLQYLTKGTAVIPHDISENLMAIGQLDPSDVLKRSTPKIGMSPSVVNNEVNITMEIAEVVHIDHVDHDTLPDLTKAVRKEMDSYMLKVNNAIRSKVR